MICVCDTGQFCKKCYGKTYYLMNKDKIQKYQRKKYLERKGIVHNNPDGFKIRHGTFLVKFE